MSHGEVPIIDSHVHLWPASEMSSLGICSSGGPFNTQMSVAEYKRSANSSSNLIGFVFVEVDRKNDVEAVQRDGAGWEGPLQEIRYLKRIALGQPLEGEGHSTEDAKLCLGIIPWAPVLSGIDVMVRYLALAKEAAGEAWPKVRGFRHLLQDKKHGTMLSDDFIESMKLLGRRDFVFEVAADHSRRGDEQLNDVLFMVRKAHNGVPEQERVKLIINHLCKPDLTICNTDSDVAFHTWRTAMYSLGKTPQVYIKLSGAYSQMTECLREDDPIHIFEAIRPWLIVLLDAFGASRILYGSDWPFCTLGVQGDSWGKWHAIVSHMSKMLKLSDDDCRMIMSGAAREAYGL